jgi:hypothetical protein
MGTELHYIETKATPGPNTMLTAIDMVIKNLEQRGLIPVSLSIHEFGESIVFNETETYWPDTEFYRRLKKEI